MPAQLDNSIKVKADWLYENKVWLRVHAFVNFNLKRNKNKNAILHCLDSLYFKHKLKKLPPEKELWPYAMAIMKNENQNYNERDTLKEAERQKNELLEFLEGIG